MYLVSSYDYKTKECNELALGSKANMLEFIEDYLFNYLRDQQGDVTPFTDLIKGKDYKLTQDQWDKTVRIYVTKSNTITNILQRKYKSQLVICSTAIQYLN